MDTNPKNDSKAEVVKVVAKTPEGDATQKTWVVTSVIALLVVLVAVFTIGNSRKVSAPVLAEGCREGDVYSQTTGKPCRMDGEEAAPVDEEAIAMVTPCKDGEAYNQNTGELCEKDASMALKSDTTGYDATLVQFTGKSIMLDAACVATPATLEAAVGTRVLVANHSSATSEVTVQGRKEMLEPYHYMTSVFKTAGDFAVTCNGTDTATVSVK